jgi:hypothetical protein
MSARTRLATFAAALVLAFGAAAAVGAAVGPIDVGDDTPMHEPVTTEPGAHDPAGHQAVPHTTQEP